MAIRFKKLQGPAIFMTTLLLCYAVLEYLALLIFFYFLPPIANPLIDNGLPVLLQSSKAQLVPEDYVALAGDSYAMGLGDWYYHEAGNAQARYHSAHLMHEQTGRDVISFGAAGTGSVRGMITEPISNLAYLNTVRNINLEPPQTLIYYFYEGNDLSENIEYLQWTSKKRSKLDRSRVYEPDYFRNYVHEVALQQDDLYQKAQHSHWQGQLFLGKFIVKASSALGGRLFTGSPDKTDNSANSDEPARSPLNRPGRFEWFEPGQINRAIVNNKELQLPDSLQGPSMDLKPAQKRLALYSFEQSLMMLREAFPQTRIAVLYIPSVVSSYDISSEQLILQTHRKQKPPPYNSAKVVEQSDWMRSSIETICNTQQVPFLDATPFIRNASQQQLLHGPLDWNHFNQTGYEALSEAAVTLLQQLD